ncbi:MAG: 50S ribosomal protein L25 [Pantoea sp. Brub]|nr:50S ribosomal protein L25 [Pantoea sp. Brub]
MFTINVKERIEKGKSASRRLRAKNFLPAIIYGKGKTNVFVELDHNILINLQTKPNFYKEIFSIVLNKKILKVKIQDIQHHPFRKRLQHIDFVLI